MIVTARGPGVWFRRLLRKLELKAEEDDRGAGRLAAPEQAVAGVPAARITILALRYVAGRMALARLEAVFRLKYLLLPGAVGLALFTDHPVGPVLLAVLFVTCVALQWMAGRAVVRLFGLREMAALDDVWAGVRTECWTNVKRELRRVGLSPRPAALPQATVAG